MSEILHKPESFTTAGCLTNWVFDQGAYRLETKELKPVILIKLLPPAHLSSHNLWCGEICNTAMLKTFSKHLRATEVMKHLELLLLKLNPQVIFA